MKVEQILNSAWSEFIFGGHLLSLGAVSIVFTSAVLLGINITIDFLLLVYLITYIIYLYNRFKEYRKDLLTNYDRTRHMAKYIKYAPAIIFCCTLIIIWILLYFGNQLSLIFGLLLFLFGLLYTIYFKKMTKKIVGFKNFYVAFLWALLVMFLVFYYSFPLNLSVLLLFAFVFLRCFMDTSFYDIKDIKSDKKEGLLTLVIIFGKRKTLKLLNLINVLTLTFIVLGVYLKLIPTFSLTLFFTVLITFCFLKKLENNKINIINIAYLSEVSIGIEKISWSFFILLGCFYYG